MLSEEEAVQKAKTLVEKWYVGEARKWLESEWIDSYRDRANGARLLVWEGSPPKGYVIVMPYQVIALSVHGERKRIFQFDMKRHFEQKRVKQP